MDIAASITATPSILVIGATGRFGQAVIRAAARSSSRPQIHAFARTPDKLPPSERSICTTVTKGDARSPDELSTALEQTNASHVIICIGVPDSLKVTDIREATAIALSSALRDTGRHTTIRVAVISAHGASGSKIRYCIPFVGPFIQWVLRHPLRDHDKQEECLISAFDHDLHTSRLLIVRPLGLTDKRARRRHAVLELKQRQASPTLTVHRDDVADWLIARICGPQPAFGGVVTIAGVCKKK